MKYGIIDRRLTVSPYSRPGIKRKATLGLVFHFTGWIPPNATPGRNTVAFFESLGVRGNALIAQANADWARGITDGAPDIYQLINRRAQAAGVSAASSNFVIGLGGADGIYRLMDEDEESYTSGWYDYSDLVKNSLMGDPNACTIGIEVAAATADGAYTEETYDMQIELAVYLLKKYSLSSNNVWRHYDMCGPKFGQKECPLWFVRNPNEWEKFKNEIARRLT